MTDKGPKFRLLKEAEINKLMADAAKKLESEKKEGE